MATVTQQSNTWSYRPQRRDSLQKMLELERLASRQRRASGSISSPVTHSKATLVRKPVPSRSPPTRSPPSPPASRSPVRAKRPSSPKRFGSPPRRQGQISMQARSTQAPQLPPLQTDIPPNGLSNTLNHSFQALQPRPADHSQPTPPAFLIPAANHNATSARSRASSSGPSYRNVSVSEAAEHHGAFCQSPSWDAYDRRKEEERLRRQEKKDQEQIDKDAQKAKRARLTKQPPTPVEEPRLGRPISIQPSSKRQASEAPRKFGHTTERPASVLGLVSLPLETSKGRSRTSSFSGLLKSLDPRKSSPNDISTFIGGIKLEQQRFEAGEPITSDTAADTSSEEDVHPAFRTVSLLKDETLPAPSRPPMHHKKLSYPPIAMQTTSKQTGYVVPHAENADSTSRSKGKWRARVGLKKPTKQVAHAEKSFVDTNTQQHKRNGGSNQIVISRPILDDETERQVARTLAESEAKKEMISPSREHARVLIQPPTPTKTTVPSPNPLERTGSTASELSVAPPPPRRSSKRKSWVPRDGRRPVPATATTLSSVQSATLPSPGLELSPGLDFHFEKKLDLLHSSSEDSASDYQHSLSRSSTPATSRDTSESELSPVLADIERFFFDCPPEKLQSRSFCLSGNQAKSKTDEAVVHPTPALNVLAKRDEKEPVGKVFVECCSCQHYHDMPSNIYEKMSTGEVRCSWCRHLMATSCCQGFAAMVYVKEKLH